MPAWWVDASLSQSHDVAVSERVGRVQNDAIIRFKAAQHGHGAAKVRAELHGTQAHAPGRIDRRDSRAVRPELRDWMAGLVRCHYPLGDPARDARIAADGLRGAKP